MMREYKDTIVRLGLSDKEALVYLVLLNEGSGTADMLAKRSGLNRSTTYVQLDVLMQLGLASTYKIGKKTYFAAESPNNLDRLVQRQELALQSQRAEIQTLLPKLMHMFSATGERPVIRTHEGKEGLATMRNEVIANADKEIFTAVSFDDLYKVFTVDELMAFSNARSKRGIISYTLYNKEGEDAIQVPPQELRRVSKEDFPFTSDIYIYGNSVSISNTTGKIFGVTIDNAEISQTFRSLFLLAWKSAENGAHE